MSWLGYGTGHHAPGIADRSQAVAAAHHTVAAHNLAIKALKAAAPGAQVGPVLNQSLPSVDDITDPFQMHVAAQYDAVQNRFWMEAILRGEYPQIVIDTLGNDLTSVIRDGGLDVTPIDWLGMNYYNNARVGHRRLTGDNDRGDWLGTGATITPLGPLTDMGWSIDPRGIGDLLVRWHREFGTLIPRMRTPRTAVRMPIGSAPMAPSTMPAAPIICAHIFVRSSGQSIPVPLSTATTNGR